MSNHKVIGYFAYASPTQVVCDGDACVIAGSKAKMEEYILNSIKKSAGDHTIKKTRFAEIMRGIEFGAAYCFDEESYSRFYPLAKKAGVDIGPQDFLQKGPGGFHFVRVQKYSISQN